MAECIVCDYCGKQSKKRWHYGADWFMELHFRLSLSVLNGRYGTVDLCSEECLKKWVEESLPVYVKEHKVRGP